MRKTERFFNTLRRYPVNPKTMVKVAIIDTGIDLEHPVLRPFHAKHQIGLCWDFVRGTAQITDSTGHGTHCAHLLLKTAPNAIIFVARVFEEAKAVEATIPLIEAVCIIIAPLASHEILNVNVDG
jgi:hypothetical protein